jgi:glutamyl-tRNA reductase
MTTALMKKVAKARRWRPLMIVDIAVPRDADPQVGKIDGVYLFDIDDLEKVVAQNLAERAKAADDAGAIVEVEARQFQQWLVGQRVVPTIRALRAEFTRVAETEAQKVIDQMHRKEMTPEQQGEAVRRLVQLIVNKLLHAPQIALKEAAAGDADALVDAVARLHRIDPEAAAEAEGAAPPPAAAEALPVAAEGGKRGTT